MAEGDGHERLREDAEADGLDRLVAECIDRLNAGEPLALEELADAYPEHAAALRTRLRTFLDLAGGKGKVTEGGELGDFQLIRRIGRGGMGVVYEAWQRSMDRRVALKLLPGGILADLKLLSRFQNEAKAAGKLSHPSVVSVFGMGVEQNTPFFAMEYVEGETLAQILRRRGAARASDRQASPSPAATRSPFDSTDLDLGRCARIAEALAAVAEGLQHAHEQGVIHRDIKPSNLIVNRDGRLRIIDFGLAKLDGQEALTLSGDLLGTPSYMSPDQARTPKSPVDHRTDVYSLGATLFEVLAGRPPFRGKDHQDTLTQVIHREPPALRGLNPRIPRDLETIVLKCLRKEPEDRYGTAEALAQDLRRFVRGDPIEARPQPRWEKIARRAWREKTRLGALAAVSLLLLLAALLTLNVHHDAERRRAEEYDRRVLTAIGAMNLGTCLTQVESRRAMASNPGFQLFDVGEHLSLLRQDTGAMVADAVEDLRRLTQKVPSRPEAPYQCARGLLLLQRPTEAMDDLRRALDARPGFAPALALKGSILEEVGDRRAAERLLAEVAVSPGGDWAAAWLEAHRAMKKQRWNEAAAAFGKVIALEERGAEAYLGSSLEVRVNRAWARLFDADLLGALDDCIVAESRWPEALEPLFVKGAVYSRLGYKAEGEAVFERLYERSGRRDAVALGIVTQYLDDRQGLRDPERALFWCEHRVRSEQHRERLRAFCLFFLGQFRKAHEAARKAIAVEPDHPAAYRVLTHMLSYGMGGIGNYEEAETLAREALRRFPSHATFYVPLETALWKQGKMAEARDALLDALKVNPEDGFLHYKLAVKLLMLGDSEGAFRLHQRANELAPHNVDVVFGLGWNLAEVGRLEQGIEVLDRCIAEHPRASVPRHERARALERLGRLEEAIEEARQSVPLPPREPWNNTYLVVLLEKAGRADEAFAACVRGVEAFPEDPEHLKLLSLLQHRNSRDGVFASGWHRMAAFLEKVHDGREAEARLLNARALARLHGQAKDFPAGLEAAKQAVASSKRLEPDILATLAEAQFLTGAKAEAVRTIEEALELPEAERKLRERLAAYRKAVLPDLPSYASIAAVLDVVDEESGEGAGIVGALRAATVGDDASRRVAYLEASLLERSGRLREGAAILGEVAAAEVMHAEPFLALTRCLRRTGDAAAAAERLRAALDTRLAERREVWDLWASVSLADLGRNPAELLENLPGDAGGSRTPTPAEDLRLLLQELREGGTVRIRCGGEELRTARGKIFAKDRFFSGGRDTRKAWLWGGLDAFPGEVRGTEDPSLYKAHRWFPKEQAVPPGYRIPLPKGTYRVTLHFAEVWFGVPGLRRFDVRLEGREVLKDHDVFAEVGFATADVRSFMEEVSDGLLEIELLPRSESAMVSAIEVERVN